MENKARKKIFVDGSGFNGSSSAYCVYFVRSKHKRKDRKFLKVFYSKYNSFDIELLGLLEAIKRVGENSNIYSDSRGAVNHVHMLERGLNSISIMIKKKNIKIKWVPRSRNLAGIYLSERLKKLKRYCLGWKNKKIR